MLRTLVLSILVLGASTALAERDAAAETESAEPTSAAEELPIPFHLPIPDDWRTETLPFPLGFAPELGYEGFDELRFAPGMFKPETEDFWTYAFVWWIPASTKISAERLEADLNAYYHGLARNVAEGKGNHEIPAAKTTAHGVDRGEGDPLRFEGTIETFDSFVTLDEITLNFRAEVIPCVSQERMAVFFELSPQPTSHPIWSALREIRTGFRCEE